LQPDTASVASAAAPGSVESANLWGGSWSAFVLSVLHLRPRSSARGPDFDAEAWQRLKSRETVICATIMPLWTYWRSCPCRAFAFFARAIVVVPIEIEYLVRPRGTFLPRPPRRPCQGGAGLHSNTDLALNGRRPDAALDVCGEVVAVAPAPLA